MSNNISQERNNDSELNQRSLAQHGTISVDNYQFDAVSIKRLNPIEATIIGSISKVSIMTSYPEYVRWKKKVLKAFKDLNLTYLIEADNLEEKVHGDHKLMSIIFDRISNFEAYENKWKSSWDELNTDLYMGDTSDKIQETNEYLRLSFDKDLLAWKSQLRAYISIAEELNIETSIQSLVTRLLKANDWNNKQEWITRFENVKSISDIVRKLHKAKMENQWSSVTTAAIVNSIEVSNTKFKSSNNNNKKRYNKPNLKSNKRQKKKSICPLCKEEGHAAGDCSRFEIKDRTSTRGTKKIGRTNQPSNNQRNGTPKNSSN